MRELYQEDMKREYPVGNQVTANYVMLTEEEFSRFLNPQEGVLNMELPMIDEELPVEQETVTEEKKTAVKMAFLGIGQGGGNIADEFWKAGYRRVSVVNTTTRDMHRLSVPVTNRHVLKSDGGAGKDPRIGKALVEGELEDIFKLLQGSFKKDVEQILICVGAGGGTGSGGVLPLVKLCKDYLISIGVQGAEQKVGCIVTLPTKEESSAVQRNALDTLMPLVEMAEKGQLSPLVLVDNARVMQLYGKSSVVDVWGKANRNIAALFDSFNLICAMDDLSVIVTCDPQDYRTVLQSGIMTFGRTKLEKVDKVTDISDAVRENVKKGLLVEGLDLSKASAGMAILIADKENLERIPQEALEGAFGSLNRLMKQGSDTKLHRGVVENTNPGVYLYTLVSGLGRPVARLQEIANKAGASYPIVG